MVCCYQNVKDKFFILNCEIACSFWIWILYNHIRFLWFLAAMNVGMLKNLEITVYKIECLSFFSWYHIQFANLIFKIEKKLREADN